MDIKTPTDASQGHEPIETDRLLIRPVHGAPSDGTASDDRAACNRLWRETLGKELTDETFAWLGLNPRQLAGLGQAPTGDRLVCLRDTGEPIGIAGLVCQPGPFALLDDPDADDSVWTLEFGLYWCTHPAHRGKGYAAEAGQAMATLAHRVARVSRVIAFTQESNTSSVRVMERLGMDIHRLASTSAPWMEVVGAKPL